MQRHQIGRSLALAVLLGASVAAVPGSAATVVRSTSAELLYDDALAEVGRAVPGFAGTWVDADTGELVVSLTHPSGAAAGAARGELARLLDRSDLAGLRVVARPARYSFGELKDWFDQATPEVLALAGTVSADVDERANVLRFGVEDLAASQAAVRAVADAHGVPAGAVVVEQVAPVTAQLRDVNVPVVGGVEIGVVATGLIGAICTLGFPAVRGGVQGIVVNSHCTGTRGVVDNTVHQQPFGGVPVGRETADPAHFTGGVCPAGRVCRYSDSAFSTLPAAALYNQGRIARPPLGSLTWNGTDTFRITSESAPVLGESLTKVGRTTGRSAGAVGQTCTTYNVSGSNITTICQGQAAYGSAPGDSGSPVFRIVSGTDVALRGIHWGSGGVFSTIANIQRTSELGSVATCATGFTC